MAEIRPYFSFIAFAAMFVVLVFHDLDRHVALVAASASAAFAFLACLAGIQMQIQGGVRSIAWGEILVPFLMMWIALHQIAQSIS
ncbi:hypothetical protein [Cupriavidus sp. MP-37]|uniref:hypothetical protein n=1 Tax=Cupriavidus sp. MP-37 TaxID=2884455 RepID=UPI001D0B9D2D|nr:hypothetical protein [Cupriavidus sp. MP-37]UDM52015.1 hypothetical protein LIN44_22515 [Cupriavidus sp. MP-37]